MKESNPYLAVERVGKLMAKYAVPCVISLLVGALYNIVDQIFIVYLCMIVFACINKACFIFLQAMGKTASSTILPMIREVVFGVGFALLPVFFGLDGVLYSMPLSDGLTFLVAVFLIIGTYRELGKDGERMSDL